MSDLDEHKIKADNIPVINKTEVFTDETVQALQDFGKVLQRIHNRLVAEGVSIEIDSHYAGTTRTK